MPNKLDKFGIKFWVLVDWNSKFIVNAFPYLGKDEARPNSIQLPEYVVRKLMTEYTGKGYNITFDNFFTSKSLADHMLAQKTSILGNSSYQSSGYSEKSKTNK